MTFKPKSSNDNVPAPRSLGCPKWLRRRSHHDHDHDGPPASPVAATGRQNPTNNNNGITSSSHQESDDDNKRHDDAIVTRSRGSGGQRELVYVRILYFVFHASLSSITPFLPLYLSQQAPHLDSTNLGLLSAIHPLSCLFTSPVWGYIADHPVMGSTGPQRALRTLLVTYVGSAVTRLAIPLGLHSFAWLALIKIVSSIFYGPAKTLMDNSVLAILATSSSSSHSGSDSSSSTSSSEGRSSSSNNFGRFRMWGQLGCAFSSALILKAMNLSSHYNPLGYNLIFVVHAILAVPTILCIFALLRNGNDNHDKAKDDDTSNNSPTAKTNKTITKADVSIREILPLLAQDGRLLQLAFFYATKGLANGFNETFVYVHIRKTYAAAAAAAAVMTDAITDNDNNNDAANDTLNSMTPQWQLGDALMLCRILLSMGSMMAFWYSKDLNRLVKSPQSILLACLYANGIILFLYSSFGGPTITTTTSSSVPSTAATTSLRIAQLFLAEFLRGMMGSLFNSTAMVYLHGIAPGNMKSTWLIIMNEFVYQGIGITCGSYLGGHLVSHFGMSQAFYHIGQILLSIVLVGSIMISRMPFFFRKEV